jgi:hypothetical protein
VERLELLAKEQELEEKHGRLRAVPHDMASHRADRERLKAPRSASTRNITNLSTIRQPQWVSP